MKIPGRWPVSILGDGPQSSDTVGFEYTHSKDSYYGMDDHKPYTIIYTPYTRSAYSDPRTHERLLDHSSFLILPMKTCY